MCYLILYSVAYRLTGNEKFVKRFISSVAISTLAISIIAIIESIWKNPLLITNKIYCAVGYGVSSSFEIGRSMATFGNTTFLAAYLAITLPLLIFYSFKNLNKLLYKLLLYSAIFLGLISLILTFGRAAWLGVLISLFLTSLLLFQGFKRSNAFRTSADKTKISQQRYFKFLIIAILLVASIAIANTISKEFSIYERLLSIAKIEGSTSTRLQMWNASLPAIKKYAFLGSGPDTFKYVFSAYKPKGWSQHINDPLLDRAHNDYIQNALTIGLFGALAYLWIFFAFFLKAANYLQLNNTEKLGYFETSNLKTYSYNPTSLDNVYLKTDYNNKILVAGLLSSSVAYFIQMQFSFSNFTTSPLFWIILGIGVKILDQLKNQKIASIGFKIGLSETQKIAAVLTVLVFSGALIICSIMPLIADYHYLKGRESEAKNDLPGAIDEYRKSITFNRYETIYYLAYADSLFVLGQNTRNNEYIKQGIKVYNFALNLNPLDEQAYFRAGAACLKVGRTINNSFLNKAIFFHTEGLKLNPQMVDAYVDIGVAYAYLNDYKKAIDNWKKAIQIESNNEQAYFNIGWAYEHLGNIVEAKKAYYKAYKINPAMHDAKAAYERL